MQKMENLSFPVQYSASLDWILERRRNYILEGAHFGG